MNNDDGYWTGPEDETDPQSANDSYEVQIARIAAVQSRYELTLMSIPHVVGVGIGLAQENGESTDQLALVVMVDEKLPLAQLTITEILPRQIEGVRIDVQETGGFSTGMDTDNSFQSF